MAARRQRELLEIGTPAPAFCLARLEGGDATLASLPAQARTLLVFFKISCPTCQLAMPYLERLHLSTGLPVYGISQNDAESTSEFIDYFKVTFPILLDPEDDAFPASNAYGLSSVPTMYLVEPDGVISRVVEGWTRIDMEKLGADAGITLFREGDNVPAWKAG